MSKNKNSCILYPEAPKGGPSKLYKELLKTIQDRPTVNYLYAAYTASNGAMGNAMEARGIKKNRQGEHTANEVLAAIGYSKWEDETRNMPQVKRLAGAIDVNDNIIDYADAWEALDKANTFNKTHDGLVAYVVKHGDVYNIQIFNKNSRTLKYPSEVEERMQIWQLNKQALAAKGIDVDALPQEAKNIVSPYQMDLARYLKNLQSINIQYLSKQDALILFGMSPNNPAIQRAINYFGSIEDAAQALYDFNQRNRTLSNQEKNMLFRAVQQGKRMGGVDLDTLINDAANISIQVAANSPEEQIGEALRELDRKYKIENNEIVRMGEKISTLSEAAADAVMTIERQIRELEQVRGDNVKGKSLEVTLNKLHHELAAKKYYTGMLNFLDEAILQIKGDPAQGVDGINEKLLKAQQSTGTDLERAFEMARILQEIKSIKDQYYKIIEALANPNLIIDEAIGQSEIDRLRQIAKDLKDFFDSKMDSLTKPDGEITSTMIIIAQEVIGSKTAPDGTLISNIIKMGTADSSIYNWLYDVGTASNPIIAAMGSIIHKAQNARNEQLDALALRIRKATDLLYKSGSNSEFMYDDNGYIISDIDWDSYEQARKAEIKSLKKAGYRGFDLKQALENWEDANMEDRVVDETTGRTEKVPNSLYRNNKAVWDNVNHKLVFNPGILTQAQQDYYDTMMQIKGEIGSLLPAYAQIQYRPPQMRRNMVDAITHAKNAKDVANAILTKVENMYKIREDDTDYNRNGIVQGQDVEITEGAYDDTPLRQIPIFFINKVEQKELLKDFSGGLQMLAGTAINYNAMHEVADVVEFIGDFVKEQPSRADKTQMDVSQSRMGKVFKALTTFSKRNLGSARLIDGWIAQHIYGQKLADSKLNKASKFLSNIIQYTSFKGLAFNLPGALANALVGEFQMLVEAGAGQYYGFRDFAWAQKQLFGAAGGAGAAAGAALGPGGIIVGAAVGAYATQGDAMELLTNNVSHKGVLLREMFDPMQEDYSDKTHQRYHKSMFRQLIAHDCSFIGYGAGEYLLHYTNMYAVLHNIKVLIDGKEATLYDALEVTKEENGNSKLELKPNVVTLADNRPVDDAFLQEVKGKIQYVNKTTHGAMNEESKGLIHQYMMGRLAMQFRQWMVGHYSRRFRARHFDSDLGTYVEGYWVSTYKWLKESLIGDKTEETLDRDDIEGMIKVLEVVGSLIKDMTTFMTRARLQWNNLDDMQRANVKRVRAEILLYFALCALSCALGEPEEHKGEFWRRWWMYQVKRMITEVQASMPHPKALSSGLTILQSPMAGVNTLNSLLYVFYGLTNGDVYKEIQTGPHQGENKYWRNVKKYDLFFFKDLEQMQSFAEKDNLFQVFEAKPSNR